LNVKELLGRMAVPNSERNLWEIGEIADIPALIRLEICIVQFHSPIIRPFPPVFKSFGQ